MDSPRANLQRERAAAHEMGHVVIAVLLGREVLNVSLEPSPSTVLVKKLTLPKRPRTDSDKARLEGEIMLAVAGIAAERVLGVEEKSSIPASLEDLNRAADLAVRLKGRARAESAVAHALATTERMLRARVETLAEGARQLAARGELDGAAIKTLVPRR